MFSKLFNKTKKFNWQTKTRDISMDLISGWMHEVEINDPQTFVKEYNGVGALQFSLATSKDEVPDMDAHFKLNKVDPDSVKKYKVKDWDFYEYDQIKDGNYIKNLNLVKENVMVYATYICGENNINKNEFNEAVKMIRSIQVAEKNSEDNQLSNYDETFAQSLIGKYVIVGYTHKKDDGTVVKYEQEHGVIIRVNEHEGVVIKPPKEKYTFTLPPDFRSFEAAKPGKYTLKSTGEVITNPDYLVYWVRDFDYEQGQKERVYQLYKNKILAVRNYQSDKKHFTVDDFTDMKSLGIVLDEVDTGESDITPAGKSFIEKYYGFAGLAKILVTQNVLTEAIKDLSFQELILWLKSLEPMFTINFIETVRGNVKKGQKLREDLLPPKDLGETE